MKSVLDVCCGGKMFYFDKQNKNVFFCDNRKIDTTLCDGRKFKVEPDIVCDFKNLPFANESYQAVVFDPPHLIRAGAKSWLAIKYGKLDAQTYKDDLQKGFAECFRVLKRGGILIFKWSDDQIKLKEILKLAPIRPLLGEKGGKTHWIIFLKGE